MTAPDYKCWEDLNIHARDSFDLNQLFEKHPGRAKSFTLEAAGVFLDYSKNLITSETIELFTRLAQELKLADKTRQMFNGDIINTTEQRAVLHTLLRAQPEDVSENLQTQFAEVQTTLEQIKRLTHEVRSGEWKGCTGKPIREVIHLGIGGSYLGPVMVDEALAPLRNKMGNSGPNIHYVANVDGEHISSVIKALDPEETLVIVVSKSFGTIETISNANTTRDWLLTAMDESQLGNHLIAVTTNTEAASEFGVELDNQLTMWDWVGGRYSLWSAVGIPIALRYGYEAFEELLAGARDMDRHFLTSAMPGNMPMILACLGIWYQHFFGSESHAVLTYDHGLRFLPDHLQQLDMESNGKSVKLNGEPVDYPTGPIIWGGEGTNGQHAFHQLLHQGNRFVGIDFIVPLKPHHDLLDQHHQLVANCLGQSQALMVGRSLEEIETPDDDVIRKHRVMPGNRPSNTLMLDQLTPRTLGALVALYEHKVFCQGLVWRINSFDQWGVELGKVLGEAVFRQIKNGQPDENVDASTANLINRYNERLDR